MVQEHIGQPPQIEVVDVNAMEEYDITLEPIIIQEDKDSKINMFEEGINHKIYRIVDLEGDLNKKLIILYDIKREVDDLKYRSHPYKWIPRENNC